MTNEININDTVRSFDFEHLRDSEGSDACFVEGIVEGFKEVEGCTRFDIKVTRVVWGGKEKEVEEGQRVFPPLNGTRTTMGSTMNGVAKIEKPKANNLIAEMDLSNLTDEQMEIIRRLVVVAEDQFDSLAENAVHTDKQKRLTNLANQCMTLRGRLRNKKENRKEAA